MANEMMFLKHLREKVSAAENAACAMAHTGTEQELQDAEQALESACAEWHTAKLDFQELEALG